LAVEEEIAKLLRKIWVCCKEAQLKPNELKNKMLPAKDNHGHNFWHIAAESNTIEILEANWNWTKEADLNPKEWLLARSGKGYTAWQIAARRIYFEILQKLRARAKKSN